MDRQFTSLGVNSGSTLTLIFSLTKLSIKRIGDSTRGTTPRLCVGQSGQCTTPAILLYDVVFDTSYQEPC